MLHENKYTSL